MNQHQKEKNFIHEATLALVSSLDSNVCLQKCLSVLSNQMPADAFLMGMVNDTAESFRAISLVTEGEFYPLNIVTKLAEESRRFVLESSQSDQPVRMINRPDSRYTAFQLSPSLGKILGGEKISWLVVNFRTNRGEMGGLALLAKGHDRFSQHHAELYSELRAPLEIALNNALRHEELIRLKTMLEEKNAELQNELGRIPGERLIGSEQGLSRVVGIVRQLGKVDTPVLILGETGVGKEVVSDLIQSESLRKDGPFVKVNCGAIPEYLIDSELFGHEKGAFTGASTRKLGKFELAHRGTIFLDEVGELSPQAQVRLLRVLQNGEIERVGGTATVPVDVRIIAATHRDLKKMVRKGEFREDLYYRLNVFPVDVPPLRERRDDIPALVQHFIEKKARTMKLPNVPRLAPRSLAVLMRHDWPGNVRELENLVERAMILTPDGPLRFDDLLFDDRDGEVGDSVGGILTLDELERRHIRAVLKLTSGRIQGAAGAAEILDIHPNTLRKRLNKLGIPYGRKASEEYSGTNN